MDRHKSLGKQRKRRQYRVRKGIRGTTDRPRLSVYRSLKHFGCQIIDDDSGKTLASASTRDASLRESVSDGGNCDAAAAVGKALAEKATAAGIKAVKLDRGSNRYHGRVRAFAEAAREAGLDF